MTEPDTQQFVQLVADELGLLSPALGLMGHVVGRHDGFGLGLLALDAQLRSLPHKVSEDAILDIRIAWWAEKLSLLPNFPQGHPLLGLLACYEVDWLAIAKPLLGGAGHALYDPMNNWKASLLFPLYDTQALLTGGQAPLAPRALEQELFQLRQVQKAERLAATKGQIAEINGMKARNVADRLLCACLQSTQKGAMAKWKTAMLGAWVGGQAAAELRKGSISLLARSQ